MAAVLTLRLAGEGGEYYFQEWLIEDESTIDVSDDLWIGEAIEERVMSGITIDGWDNAIRIHNSGEDYPGLKPITFTDEYGKEVTKYCFPHYEDRDDLRSITYIDENGNEVTSYYLSLYED